MKGIKQTDTIAERVLSKIERLLKNGVEIELLPTMEHSKDRCRIDKFIIACESSSNSHGDTSWTRYIYCDYARHPIVCGQEAENIYKKVIGEKSILDKYLEL